MKQQAIPYLIFDGNVYQDVFEGEVTVLQTIGEVIIQLPEANDKIIHAKFKKYGVFI